MTVKNTTSLLLTEANEFVKSFTEYDGSDRVSKVYMAREGAAQGDPCTVTEYTYVGATTRVEKMKETQGVWQSSYDI